MADTTNTTTVHTAEVVRYDDPVIITERAAVAAFIAGYTDPTRRSYATDLRIFASWCHEHGFNLLNVKRPHLETFARGMEQLPQRLVIADIGDQGLQLRNVHVRERFQSVALKPKQLSVGSRTIAARKYWLSDVRPTLGCGDAWQIRPWTIATLLEMFVSERPHRSDGRK